MSAGFTINQDRMTWNARMYGNRTSGSSTGADATQLVCGFDISNPAPNKAAVVSIDSPSVFCGGTQTIYATIGNFGSNQLKEVTVNWSLDGVSQTAVTYKNVLDTIGGSGSNEAQIYLGSAIFNTKRNIFKNWQKNINCPIKLFMIRKINCLQYQLLFQKMI